MDNGQKKYRVVVGDNAKIMFRNHVRFLSNVSSGAARKLQSRIDEGVQSLRYMPHRCPTYAAHRTNGIFRRLIIDKRYQIIFSIDEQKAVVNVRYIWDSRQDNVI
jgi:plasmid stabilization system protein ParE